MKYSIFFKFVFTVLLIAVLTGITGIYFFSKQQRKVYEEYYFNSANSVTRSLDASISENILNSPKDLKNILYKLLLLNPDILAISVNLEQNGNIVKYVNTDESGFISEQSSEDDIDNKKVFDTNLSLYHRDTYRDKESLEITSPLHLSGKTAGTYNVIISLSDFNASQRTNILKMAIPMFGSIFSLIAIIAFLLKYVVINPLQKLIRATKQIEKEDFNINIDANGSDEISDLSKSYLQMTEKLKRSRQELEKRVSEKTIELRELLNKSNDSNKKLADNKVAMLNLLEDAKSLEEELRLEKQNVEKNVIERTKELDDEKDKLTASIEALSNAFVMFDLNSNIILVNDNLNKIFNEVKKKWTIEDIQEKLGQGFDFIKAYKLIVYNNERKQYDNIAYGSRVLHIKFSPVYGGSQGGRIIIGILSVITDVTEEKILERSKDEFFSIASHELRTPLTAIRGNTSMMIDYYKEVFKDPELKQMISDTHDASTRLIGIVNDFLDMSRLEMSKIEFKLENVNIADVVKETLKEYEVTGNQNKLTLELLPSEEPVPLVLADRNRIKQVIINLVGNGIKFTTKGGISIQLKKNGKFVEVRVIDTGNGISLSNQPLLFRKFQQAGSSTMTRDAAKGTGLGLYISKLMVEGMGGKIYLEKSEEGKGSVFTFTLPVVELKAE